MNIKLLIAIWTILLFSACSDKNNRDMYDRKENFFDSHLNTSAENDYRDMQNAENPMKRPSYDEYRQK